MAEKLSSSSYAVLGMLALRPWTPYELTQQFLRSLTYCWPVSERLLYTEPDKLVGQRLAKVRTTRDGSRRRREYSITAAGRAALREWLATAPSPPRIFNEPLLRVLFADQAEPTDLVDALTVTRDAARAQLAAGAAQVAGYLHGGGPFPERAHLVALFADLQHRIVSAVEEWASEAIPEVASWPSTRDLGLTDAARRRLEVVANPRR